MGTEEQQSQIGKAVIERNNLRRELACCQQKADAMQQSMRRVTDMLSPRKITEVDRDEMARLENERTYPTLEEVVQIIKDIRNRSSEMRKLEEFIQNVS